MCGINNTRFGAVPANIVWDVVRGDTATLVIDFLESDESTGWDTTGWTYSATAYDKFGDVLDELTVESEGYSVAITAPACVTANWGTSYGFSVANLIFDLQVTIPASGEDTVWTPVVGSINVIGDVTPGGLL